MEPAPAVRTIETPVHGRHLVLVPDAPGPWPALFSFHGYGEDAAVNLAALQRIPNVRTWLQVAVQALHPFYTKDQRVVASWMTRQDRDLAIADNVRYVLNVAAAVQREFSTSQSPLVFAGFSQGVAMAYRAAAHIPADGLIVLAGDVPPDVADHQLPPVLIGRGLADTWYTEEKMAADVRRLDGLARTVQTCVFDGGHEWTDEFAATAGEFLDRIAAPLAPGP